MCDTFVATASSTKNGAKIIFGKNSDREPNEAQAVLRIPRIRHSESHIQIGRCKVPQVKETYEVILSKPFQMWGAEMGVNEFGVVIGNEAVFTKIPIPKKNDGLTGMDLLRLALERSKNKEEALQSITQHLEEYGQDALGGYKNTGFFYHNSFLIADPQGAILLETVDRHWVSKKVDGFYAISNGLTIGEEFESASEGIFDFAEKHGLWKKGERFHFARCFSDWFYTKMSHCNHRRKLAFQKWEEDASSGGIGVGEAMDILRSHNQNPYDPKNGDMGSICLHATGLFTPNQTVGSMVVEIHNNEKITVWLTGTSAPCLSMFKPFYFGTRFLEEGKHNSPGAYYNPDSLWWKQEWFHRLALKNYESAKNTVDSIVPKRESEWIQKDQEIQQSHQPEFQKKEELSAMSWKQHELDLEQWTQELTKHSSHSGFAPFYSLYWWKQNHEAKLEL